MLIPRWTKKSLNLRYLLVLAVFLSGIVAVYIPANASAAQITGRSLTLSNPVGGATSNYTFNFTVPTTGTIVKSVGIAICTTASGTCSTPAGFVNSSSISQPTNLGDASGWTGNNATAGELRLAKSGNSATPSGSQTVVFTGVTNRTGSGVFYAQITTYANDNWTSAIDTGTVAAVTASAVTVSVNVDETLAFSLLSTSVSLANSSGGNINTSATAYGTSQMTASTNANSGYVIKVSGSTLTGPSSETLTALSTPTASSAGSRQFGINLMNNATPNVGTDPASGNGDAATDYDTADLYKFVSGNTIASSAGISDTTTYTVSYIANADTTAPAGNYTTTLTYTCTPTF